MNNINLPIETIREGNKITKICVEDVYKMYNRIKVIMNKSYSNISSIFNSIQKNYKGSDGKLIIGKGTSQPCLTDAFDEEIGNNIAFMKAKLNANVKKYNLLKRAAREIRNLEIALYKEMDTISAYIDLDLDGIRKHNSDYLKDSENWW